MRDPTRLRLVLLLVALPCLVLPACTGADRPERTPSPPDREEIASAIDGYADVISDFDQVRAIVVATDDETVFEEYYATDQHTYWDVKSVTKSVVSTLVGIALDEGLIGSVDDTLEQLLPRYADVMSPAVAGITLRQLLTHTAGFSGEGEAPVPEFTRSKDWVHEILTSPKAPPGKFFRYSDATSHLVAAVLQEATGTSALHYARSRLFGPLGIDTRPALRRVVPREPSAEDIAAYDNAGFAWPVDPQGVSTGWWGIKLRPQDLVKLGQLFLGGGRWGDEQVVPAEWVAQSTTKQVATDGTGESSGDRRPVGHGDGYGYQWWTGTVEGDESFRAVGIGGQLVEVVPDRNLVVVTTTEMRFDDPTSRGIDFPILQNIIEDAIVSQFPAK